MTEKVKLQSLECSLCQEAFKDPIVLFCGHTFCKVCLCKCDEQHRSKNFMRCPLCRKRFKLGENRVAIFPSNFSLKGIEDEFHEYLKVNGTSAEYCSLHSEVFKDIMCEVCKKCICLICFLDKHQGHTFKKKEAVVAELKKKGNSIIRRSDEKKGEIKESITNAEHHKRDMHSHLENVDRDIKTSFRKMLKILRGNKQRLLKENDDIRKNSGKVLTDFIERQERSLQSICEKSSLMGQEDIAGTSTDALTTLYIEFQSLKKELEKDPNDPSIAHALQEVENTRFCPSNDLDLGAVGHDTNESEIDLDQGSLDHGSSESESDLDQSSLGQDASENGDDLDQGSLGQDASESGNDPDQGSLGQDASENGDDLDLGTLSQDASESDYDLDQGSLGQDANESWDDLDQRSLDQDANESEDDLEEGSLDQEASESENDSDQGSQEASESEDDLDEDSLDLEVSKSENDLDEASPNLRVLKLQDRVIRR